MIFVTSDPHFDHDKEFLWGGRGFKNVHEMNDCLFDNWNSVVNYKDTVYVVGDFAFTNSVDRMKWLIRNLHGNIIFTMGNHDRLFKKKNKVLEILNEPYVPLARTIKFEGVHMILNHFEQKTWDRSHYGTWHLFGHSHGKAIEEPALKFEIGVDTNNFTPWSFDQISERMNKKAEKLEEWSKLDPVLRCLLTVKLIDGEYAFVEWSKPNNIIRTLFELNKFFLRRLFR